MPSVVLSTIGGAGSQFFDSNGDVLAGGKLYAYEAGTTTPLATYTDSSGTTPHPHPVVLDAGGRVPDNGVWLTYGVQYKVVLKSADGVTVGTWDNFPGDAQYLAIGSIETEAVGLQVRLDAIAGCFVSASHTGSDQNILNNIYTRLEFNNEITDLGADYDPVAYDFTAPETGVYIVRFGGFFLLNGALSGVYDDVSVGISLNGASAMTYDLGNFIATTGRTSSLLTSSTPIRLTAGDKVSILARTFGNWKFSVSNSSLVITRIS